MKNLTLTNAHILDADKEEPSPLSNISICDDVIESIEPAGGAINGDTIDLCGRFVLPGLIDCHAHPFLADTNISHLKDVPPTLMTARASNIMKRMLMRGFTTIRDAAGADWGIKKAVEDGEVIGPRMFIAARAISQTGGHGDMRSRTDLESPCRCNDALSYMAVLADGIDEVRKAVREQLRQGADQIKIMVSGGVSSPLDPLECNQFSREEIRTIVEEAERRNTYVMAHAYGADAIAVAVEEGVRTIEHGNLIDDETAKIAAQKNAYVVPTLVTYTVLEEEGRRTGWSDEMLAKLQTVMDAGLDSIRICKKNGVKLGFGTDLLGDSFDHQSREFLIRSEVETPREIIRSATRTNAEILNRSGLLGEVSVDSKADLIVLDENPFEDLGMLQGQGEHMHMIMKDGVVFKNELT